MEKERRKYSCNDCLRKGTAVCQDCVATEFPSGGTSKPSHYKEREQDEKQRKVVIVCIGTPESDELMPKQEHDAKRLAAIKAAVDKCLKDGRQIPDEWITEYNELSKK